MIFAIQKKGCEEQYLSCYSPDFNHTLKVGSWDEQQQHNKNNNNKNNSTNNNNTNNISSINDFILT